MSEPIEVDYRPPGIQIVDRLLPPNFRGRHHNATRMLIARDSEGHDLVIAWDRGTFWHIDVESVAFESVGLKSIASEAAIGFRVRTEAQAADWLALIGTAVSRW